MHLLSILPPSHLQLLMVALWEPEWHSATAVCWTPEHNGPPLGLHGGQDHDGPGFETICGSDTTKSFCMESQVHCYQQQRSTWALCICGSTSYVSPATMLQDDMPMSTGTQTTYGVTIQSSLLLSWTTAGADNGLGNPIRTTSSCSSRIHETFTACPTYM